MDISYPHQWSKIHHDWTYGVIIVKPGMARFEPDHHQILDLNHPLDPGEASSIQTLSHNFVNQIEIDLWNDAKEIRFINSSVGVL